MNRYETDLVCKLCFNETRFRYDPFLEKSGKDGTCNKCEREWVGIHVCYYNADRRYYEIRPRALFSENRLCNYAVSKCYKGRNCRYAHNELELEIWIQEKQFQERVKTCVGRIHCVICKLVVRDVYELEMHLQSFEHVAKTERMNILPEVGSSLQYEGPIRERPKIPYNKDTYDLCPDIIKLGKCNYFAGCKNAHTEEELKVWKEAQRFEEETKRLNRERREQRLRPQGESSSSSKLEKLINKRKSELNLRLSETVEDNDYLKKQYREMELIGIEAVIENNLNHVEILFDKDLEQTMDNAEKEFRWIITIKSSTPEILHGVVLHDHRNMFKLGGVYKGVEGGNFDEIKNPFVPDRTCYQLHQELDNDTFMEIDLRFRPKMGEHGVNLVLELMEGVLVGRKVKVKVTGVEFREASKNFRAETEPAPRNNINQEILAVNWEKKYRLINAIKFTNKHKMPDNIEDRIKTGFYDNINDKIVKENYVIRFQTLLYLEEFEHKRSLLKYDLIDFRIDYDTVEMEIIVQNDYGKKRVETAQPYCRFIRFNLNQQLFEGYRTFRPPKIAYIIPKYTKIAYECKCVRTGIDYLIFSITLDTINACVKRGGLAMVRFTPEYDEYEKMHQALEYMEPLKEAILFPTSREVRIPDHWDEDHLLSLLESEILSNTQKEAVYCIINNKYTSIPSIVCGPFGCGKTQTLAIAAKLIALNFRGSRILIAAKTNSCANIYIEFLSKYFSSIVMLHAERDGRPILFRHFAMTRNINWDRETHDFANIYKGFYERLQIFELQRCSIIVTTTVACSSLIDKMDRIEAANLFTHIFIDEAAQLIEPEACIPLSLAGPGTKVVLAGDVRQSRPLILSKQGRRYHLDQSLLERLETLPEYQSHSSYKCWISLKDNFRSSVEIVNFLSELFYDNSLRAIPPRLEGPVNFPSLSFIDVKGEEERLHGFPSFYNEEEAETTVYVLKKFAHLGVKVENMVVLTTYKSQVRLIYDYLREENRKCRNRGYFQDTDHSCIENNCVNKNTIDVRNLEGIQGREYDLVIVNTVRTTTNVPNEITLEEKLDLGLLDDVHQFNTVIASARGWVVVIGDSDCVTNIGDCSNVWTMYVNACKGYGGFFKSLEDFESFEVKRAAKKEKEVNNMETILTKSRTTKTGPEAPVHEDFNKIYQVKFDSLHTVITVCHHELTLVYANDITQAINEQLTFVKIAQENLERQRYLIQEIQTRTHSSVYTHDQGAMSIFVGNCEAEDITGDMYEIKFKSLYTVKTICQQELSLISANTEITGTLDEQLNFTRFALDNLERQRALEQQAILTEIHPSVRNLPNNIATRGTSQPRNSSNSPWSCVVV